MTKFEQLLEQWDWAAFANCPGRYRMRVVPDNISPEALLGDNIPIYTFEQSTAKDLVKVARFDGGGLITYVRPNGKYHHTLNTEFGLERKLRGLGIELPPA